MIWKYLSVLVLGLMLPLAGQGQTVEVAKEHLMAHQREKEQMPSKFELTDHYRDEQNGISHFYFQQYWHTYPVRDGHGGVHFSASGELIHLNCQVENWGDLAKQYPQISKELVWAQVSSRRQNDKLDKESRLIVLKNAVGQPELCWEISGMDLTSGTYWVEWLSATDGKLKEHRERIADCHFAAAHRAKAEPEFCYSNDGAATSLVLEKALAYPPLAVRQPVNTPAASNFPGRYNVFALPKESPLTASRQLDSANILVDPLASPFGWHDTDGVATTAEFVYTKGNNVYAYYATPPVENPPAVPIVRETGTGNYLAGNVPWPAGSTLDFNYNHAIDQPVGSAFIEDAVTNLFVVVNQTHDIFYRYGFNETSGNFQTTNYLGSGLGNDAVIARAQDGGGINQASFSTPPDGMAPTMRMHLWNTNQPNSARDGDFENSVIIHEYGHGVAYRLVQGPGTVDCFFNFEQGGEGWSDFFGLLLTLNDYNGNGAIDRQLLGEGIRGLGHFVLTRTQDNSGLRPRHYTGIMETDAAYFNEYTYADLPALGFPHGTGFLWATMLWDLTLDLMDVYGFEADLANAGSSAGNVKAMKLVIEGLKITPCNPNFIHMRDAILAADLALYGGSNQSLLWAAFARRGLGVSASAGGNAAFDRPELQVAVEASLGSAVPGEPFTYQLTVSNNTNGFLTSSNLVNELDNRLEILSFSPGGSQQANTVTFSDLGNVAPGSSTVRNIDVRYQDAATTSVLVDLPVETTDLGNFVEAGLWIPSNDYPNPNSGSTQSWFHLASSTPLESSLIFNLNLSAGANNHLVFFHDYDLETGLDGGVLEILVGGEWVDLDDQIIEGGYTAVIRDDITTPIGVPLPFTTLSRRRAWTGTNNGYQRCMVDLTDYTGTVSLRFRFASNSGNNVSNCDGQPGGCDGWFIDDIQLLDLVHVEHAACLVSGGGTVNICGEAQRPGTIIWPGEALPLVDLNLRLKNREDGLELTWNASLFDPSIDYYLERSDENDPVFRKLITAHTTAVYLDDRLQANKTYFYRIMGYDESQIPHFTRTVSGSIFPPFSLEVIPNPARNQVRIVWNGLPTDQAVKMELMTVTGVAIKTLKIEGPANWLDLNTSEFHRGVYLLRLSSGSNVQVKKLVLQ